MAAMPKAAIAVSDIRFRLDMVAIQLSFLRVEIHYDGRERSLSLLAKAMSKSLSIGPWQQLLSPAPERRAFPKAGTKLANELQAEEFKEFLSATEQAIHVLLVCLNARLTVRVDSHPSSLNDGGQHHHLEKLPHVEFIDAGEV